MTEQELKEIEARANAATLGPWVIGEYGIHSPSGSHMVDHCDPCSGDDIKFIAHARTDVPNLIAEIHKLRTEREKFLDALAYYADPDTYSQGEDLLDDLSKTPNGSGGYEMKPGKRARVALDLEEAK